MKVSHGAGSAIGIAAAVSTGMYVYLENLDERTKRAIKEIPQGVHAEDIVHYSIDGPRQALSRIGAPDLARLVRSRRRAPAAAIRRVGRPDPPWALK